MRIVVGGLAGTDPEDRTATAVRQLTVERSDTMNHHTQ